MSKDSKNAAKDAIKAYLDNRAASDELFAASYAKENKNIDECFNYILGEAKKRGNQVCMTDEEVFGLAVHYYDEDNIKVEKVTSNYLATTSDRQKSHEVELTEEEKTAAREAAIKRYEEKCLAEEAERVAKRKKAEAERRKLEKEKYVIPSLFD